VPTGDIKQKEQLISILLFFIIFSTKRRRFLKTLQGQDIRTIALPFFNNLKEEQIDYVVEKFKEGIEISRWSLVFSKTPTLVLLMRGGGNN